MLAIVAHPSGEFWAGQLSIGVACYKTLCASAFRCGAETLGCGPSRARFHVSCEKRGCTLGGGKRRRRPGREAYFERIRADQRTAIGFLLGRKKAEHKGGQKDRLTDGQKHDRTDG